MSGPLDPGGEMYRRSESDLPSCHVFDCPEHPLNPGHGVGHGCSCPRLESDLSTCEACGLVDGLHAHGCPRRPESELEVRPPGIRSLRRRVEQFDRTKGEYPLTVTIPTRLAAVLLEAFDEECCA